MALFNKKSSAEEVIKLFEKLSDEDKKVVKSHFGEKAEDLEKAEDEREIDKVEEEKADTKDKAEDKAEDVKEESEEIGKDVDEAKEDEPVEKDDKDEIEKAEEDKADATNAKLEAFMEEFQTYKGKVDKLIAKLDELEEPAESAGLGKQKVVEEAESDDDLSAHDYAMKHARY